MAILTRIDDVDVMLGDIPPLPRQDAALSESQFISLYNKVRELITKVNGRISHGTGLNAHRGNIDEQFIDYVVPSAANTEFSVPHGLDRLVQGYEVVRKDRAVDIYDS